MDSKQRPVEIQIEIVKANGLARADFGGRGKSDPFVECMVLGETLHKTKTINDNLDPEWEEEKFVVEVPYLRGPMHFHAPCLRLHFRRRFVWAIVSQ